MNRGLVALGACAALGSVIAFIVIRGERPAEQVPVSTVTESARAAPLNPAEASIPSTMSLDQARAEFLEAKPMLFRACIEPAQAKGTVGNPADLMFRLDFAPDGKGSGVGVRWKNGGIDPLVVECIRGKAPKMDIGPTGKSEAVLIEVTFP
jgi:hypothetical protein